MITVGMLNGPQIRQLIMGNDLDDTMNIQKHMDISLKMVVISLKKDANILSDYCSI